MGKKKNNQQPIREKKWKVQRPEETRSIEEMRSAVDLNEEVWVPCNYEGKVSQFYDVSSKGRVRNDKTGQFQSIYTNTRGRHVVHLSMDYGNTRCELDKLIMMSFEPREDHHKMEANHKDGNLTNDWYKNLEWIEKSKQVVDTAYIDNNQKIQQYKLAGDLVAEYDSLVEVEEQNPKFNATTIQRCIDDNTHKSYGFIWRFIDESDTDDSDGKKIYIYNLEKTNLLAVYPYTKPAQGFLGVAEETIRRYASGKKHKKYYISYKYLFK